MGKLISKNKGPQPNSKIGKDTSCPICGKFFNKKSTYEAVNFHIDDCTRESNNKVSEENKEENIFDSIQFGDSKNSPSFGVEDKNNNSDIQKNMTFECKLEIFKKNMKSLKTDWRDGCCTISVSRENVVKQSMEQFVFIDLFKELKINFVGEISSDAGGLIREWYSVILLEIQDENKKLFQRSDTEEISFIIHKNIHQTVDNLEIFNFIGKIIGKALLENLNINTCFNKLLYKMILSEEIIMDDLEFYDKSLFLSLKELHDITNIEELGMFFVADYEIDGVVYSDELISNGSNIPVTNNNLDKFVEKKIQYIVKQHTPYLLELKAGLFSIIPQSFLTLFNSSELELVLNGIGLIDVSDWKDNTIYQGCYNSSHKVIKWFWKILEKMSQDDRTKFLRFCTGTSRLPIGGFKFLESNRGQISKFCIVSVELAKGKHNFIRAHTCFNRIDLPKFTREEEVVNAIDFVLKNDLYGFGID